MNRTSGQLIAHLSPKMGGPAFCKSRMACMTVTADNTLGYQICKRCAKRLAKVKHAAAMKEAAKAASPTYVVVENAGYEGERDVRRCISYGSAIGWQNQHYSESERERMHIAICSENEAGQRSYEI